MIEAYGKNSESEIVENTKALFSMREFETKDGSLKFVFEQPFRLTSRDSGMILMTDLGQI